MIEFGIDPTVDMTCTVRVIGSVGEDDFHDTADGFSAFWWNGESSSWEFRAGIDAQGLTSTTTYASGQPVVDSDGRFDHSWTITPTTTSGNQSLYLVFRDHDNGDASVGHTVAIWDVEVSTDVDIPLRSRPGTRRSFFT